VRHVPKQLVDLMKEFIQPEGLFEKPVYPRSLLFNPTHSHIPPGAQNDLDLGVKRADLPGNLQSGEIRHSEIGDQDVEGLCPEHLYPIDPTPRPHRDVSLQLEEISDDLDQVRFVINDQYTSGQMPCRS
jgi:hypothetical protein